MVEDAFGRLESEYCPPLDPALLSAILSDYDLTEESNVQEARATLDPLKESALSEEELGFDASGTGGREHGSVDERAESGRDSASVSRYTDLSSVSHGIASLNLEQSAHDGAENGSTEDLENLSEEDKISTLVAVFEGRVTRYSVQHTLKKCNWKWHIAMEELLNHVYLNDTEGSSDEKKVSTKSVDAFSEENIHRRGRKGKNRQKALRVRDINSASSTPEGSPAPSTNRWQSSTQDIDFIASRVSTPRATIASMYSKNNSSLPKTIAAVLKLERADDFSEPLSDPLMIANAHDLQSDFSSLPQSYINAIVFITHPSLATASDLAAALTRPPSPPTTGGGIQIIPQYTKPNLDFSDDDHLSVRSSRPVSSLSHSDSTALAGTYAQSRSLALEQARAAHRRARSNRLMSGAAAYYHQEASNYSSLSSAATASAADHLASSQSTATSVDLHGIDVLNGVRIARERVEAWWNGLGEHRVNGRVGAEGRSEGFRVVVGRGTHSVGGKGRLGPAVGGMLKREGWRVQDEGAVLWVKGRVK
ncbi:unnamed protein product [Zymoseptoria tritici ST99CH_1E4]|uniref:Smr domain-containing protein n=1 Tax=Zymoseptoria tritici ST99CH_1E4 TaxID=1276532 RepID=A0A2H1FM00_ZYMTR|nr:unnamed protein product [Zymoseptoria tritici ST99CH_1E4]